jgi:3-hydroxyisobutyrate dehydrogenase
MPKAIARETIAVLGAGGSLGFPIARSIVVAGMDVRAWDKARGRSEPLTGHGAYVTDSAREAVRGAGIVLTMIPDPGELIAVMEGGVLDQMRAADSEHHAIWLQMAAIGDEHTQRCIRLAGGYGIGFVDAQVIGTGREAARGRLIVVESGPEEARPRVQPVFDALGCRTVRAGEAGAPSQPKDDRR